METAVLLELAAEVLDKMRAQNARAGDFVEFGCYKGDTSLLLQKLLTSEARTGSEAGNGAGDFWPRLWIYDSFAGLPAKTREDNSVAGDEFRQGELPVTKREVVEKFKKAGVKVPIIRKGFFEELDDSENSRDLPEKIAFAFLDGDLYQSIKTSLALVTPWRVE